MESTIEYTLSREVLRKLNLAAKVETSEDRSIICSEVFNDITGDIDRRAQAALNAEMSSSFYEVLAPFYCKNSDAAEALLWVIKPLWSQPYVVSVFALLLHQWLLQASGAVGSRASKLMNVLLAGVKQLFELDMAWGTARFDALYHNIFTAIACKTSPAISGDAREQALARDPLIKLVAAYTPYYTWPSKVKQRLLTLPALSAHGHNGGLLQDYAVTQIARLLHRIPSVKGLVRYLAGLEPLLQQSGEWKRGVRTVTLIRLQSALYSLTLPGGPRYCPSDIRRKALALLDDAFPTGSRSRAAVHFAFRLMHPSDWPGLVCLWLHSKYVWVRGTLLAGIGILLSLFRMLLARLHLYR